MADDDDEYFVADRQPSVRGGRPAVGSEPRSGSAKAAMNEDVGPLPVWGWAVVAVAAVFLWRRLRSSGSTSTTGSVIGGTEPSPGQTLGGVFLLPGSGGGDGGVSSSQIPSPDTAVDELAQAYWDQSSLSAAGKAMSLVPPTSDYVYHEGGNPPKDVAAKFYGTLASQPTPTAKLALGQFYAGNAAKASLGLPYFTGVFDGANPEVYNPATGKTDTIDIATGKVI